MLHDGSKHLVWINSEFFLPDEAKMTTRRILAAWSEKVGMDIVGQAMKQLAASEGVNA